MSTRILWLLVATMLGNVVTWAEQIARETASASERRLAHRIAESARAMQADALLPVQDEVAAAGEPAAGEPRVLRGAAAYDPPGPAPAEEEAEPDEEADSREQVPPRNPWKTVALVTLGLLALTYLGFWIGAGLVHG
ncbi:MAG: hypothetical protein QJR14_07130 [Bacillota bacterium]|nr:hypothetical protein [Bacillota bacterium]